MGYKVHVLHLKQIPLQANNHNLISIPHLIQ